VYVSKDLTVDTDTFHVDTTNNRVGIETKTPSANLHVVGNVYVSSNLTIDTDTLHVDALTHSVGIETNTPSANLHVVGNVYVSSNLTVDTNTLHVDAANDRVGLGTTQPNYKLDVNGTGRVTGGLIINTGEVAKKTYSFSNTITTGSEPEINVYFSSNVFYSKITAQLNDLDNEVSTLVVECGGGSRKGTPLNVAIGTKNIFGSASTNPWGSTVGVGTDHVSFKPHTTIDNVDGGDYHVFIEYNSPDATSGKVSKITKDGSDEITFDY